MIIMVLLKIKKKCIYERERKSELGEGLGEGQADSAMSLDPN